jgi:cellulose synthase/poly-beta-1,6-N-acetylglucosamine synthase-like glycosyltransferase
MGKWRGRFRLVSDQVPRIDVVIPCCREPLDVLQDTVLASLALDYPEHLFRVIVSDDGGSEALRAWCNGLGRHNLFYTARVKTGAAGFKAGNLNHAVRFIELDLKGKPAEFIASLDADMIPEKSWLRAVMPHILMDPRLGMAVATQVCESENEELIPKIWVR